jgi:FMN-dependent NADH-azoreductase
MWNFSLPYKLKRWFDVIVQPGVTFRFDPSTGYKALLKDRPTVVVVASGHALSTRGAAVHRRQRCPHRADWADSAPAEPIKAAREAAHRRLAELATLF